MPFRGNEDIDTANLLTREEAHTVYINQAGDRMDGDLDMNNQKLKNARLEGCTVPDPPETDTQLVNKAYVDTRLTGLDAIYVNEAGDTLEGPLRMSRNRITGLPHPTDDADAVNKKYADRHRSHFTFGANALQVLKLVD